MAHPRGVRLAVHTGYTSERVLVGTRGHAGVAENPVAVGLSYPPVPSRAPSTSVYETEGHRFESCLAHLTKGPAQAGFSASQAGSRSSPDWPSSHACPTAESPAWEKM